MAIDVLTSPDEVVTAVERACFELRSGRAVKVTHGTESIVIRSAEMAVDFGELEGHVVSVVEPKALAQWYPELCEGGVGVSTPATALENAAITLMKYAELLPVVVIDAAEVEPTMEVTAEQVGVYRASLAATLREVASAKLPLKGAEEAQVKVFRSRQGGREHLALIIGDALASGDVPLVRVHSSCITGDILGSLRCDCGDQLQLAIRQMAASGGGVLCYLNQEGRGIGIGNKIRAYMLQEQGQDTRTANESLGFEGDERHFLLAAAMLKALGVERLRLMTNNPKKVDDLCALGVEVVERVAVIATPTEHNKGYLRAKAERFSHHLPWSEGSSQN